MYNITYSYFNTNRKEVKYWWSYLPWSCKRNRARVTELSIN